MQKKNAIQYFDNRQLEKAFKHLW